MKDAIGQPIKKTKTCRVAGMALSSWTDAWFYIGKISRISKKDEGIYIRSGGETFYIAAEDCVVLHP